MPEQVRDVWMQWRNELQLLAGQHINRCYFPKDVQIISTQLHSFSDASERAYSGVVYLRLLDSDGNVHVS